MVPFSDDQDGLLFAVPDEMSEMHVNTCGSKQGVGLHPILAHSVKLVIADTAMQVGKPK